MIEKCNVRHYTQAHFRAAKAAILIGDIGKARAHFAAVTNSGEEKEKKDSVEEEIAEDLKGRCHEILDVEGFFNVFRAAGSGLDPDSIGSVNPDPDPGGQK